MRAHGVRYSMTFFSIGSTVTPVCTHPRDSAFDLVGGALELDRDQAHLLRDAGAANIENEVKFLHQLIKNRLADEGFRG